MSAKHELFSALVAALPGKVFSNNSDIYTTSISSYFFQESRLKPACVVKPQSAEDVSRAVVTLKGFYDRKLDRFLFAVKSGGHSPIAGAANVKDGVTLDLGDLNDISVSQDNQTVTVGTGAQWQNIYKVVEPLGIMVNGGRVPGIGAGGFLTGGGISYFSPGNGWGCDNVLDFEVVVADGSIIHANAESHHELFKSLKGGSNNFGIVTKFKLRTFTNTQIWGGLAYHPFMWTHKSQLKALADFFEPANYDPAATLIIGFVYGPYGFGISNILNYAKPVKKPTVFKNFNAIWPKLINSQRLANLSSFVEEQGKYQPDDDRGRYISTVFEPSLELFTEAYKIWKRSVEEVRGVKGIQWAMMFQPLPLTRADNALGLEPGHGPLVICLLAPSWKRVEDDSLMMEASHRFINDIERVTKAAGAYNSFKYLNYVSELQDPFDGYGEKSKAMLQSVSRRYDPEGFFQRGLAGPFKLFS